MYTATGLGTLDIKDLVISDDLYWKRLQEYRRELREFRRKIEKMISIEDARADEFDVRYKKWFTFLIGDKIWQVEEV